MDKSKLVLDKRQILLQKPLGWILENASLISKHQLEVALLDQNRLDCLQEPHLKIGEILALRGWIKQETADFFVISFPALLMSSQKHKIGFYLVSAGLLEEEQIKIILNEQKKIPMKFGLIAIQRKWIKPKTLEFFLDCFKPCDVILLP
jgi:hypothetical protein